MTRANSFTSNFALIKVCAFLFTSIRKRRENMATMIDIYLAAAWFFIGWICRILYDYFTKKGDKK